MNFFYIFAGIDQQLIETCPIEERVRNFAIGFLVFLISSMGFLSVSYACLKFVQINARDNFLSIFFTYSLCLFLGLVWFLIISNIYRAFLTIAGIGDGTSKITKTEFVNAIPQLVLIIFLGCCLSAPMTVLLLNKEIVNVATTNDVDRLHLNEQTLTDSKIDDFDLNNSQIQREGNILRLRDYELLNEKQAAYKKRYSNSFVGILIKCYRQHTFLSLVILIFTVFLYLSPLLLRLVWVKGQYEHKVDFQNRLVLEVNGIYPDYYLIKYNREEYYQDKFLASEQDWDAGGTLGGKIPDKPRIRKNI